MSSLPGDLDGHIIVVVVPAYQVETHIGQVLADIPSFVRHIVVVDDGSTDRTAGAVKRYALADARVDLIQHERNRGVGAAMKTGMQVARDLGAQVVVKVDGDGQMPPERIRELVEPLVAGRADFCKGNRFRRPHSLRAMPLIRRAGNLGLSFLAKAATGYWNTFDPTNGFLAIHRETLGVLQLHQLDDGYFFEISLLAELYFHGAVVHEVSMPSQYANERSNLSISRILLSFPPKLIRLLLRRLALRYFVYDFSMGSIYMITGLPLLAFGLVFGGLNWYRYSQLQVLAPTGTIMVATLSVILGFQLLLSAIGVDLQSVPKEPVSEPLRSREQQ